MAQVELRRGLPRVAGGEPWPPAGTVEPGAAEVLVALRRGLPRTPGGEPWPPAGQVAVAAPPAEPAVQEEPVVSTGAATENTVRIAVRRGLPRVAGGEPWPPSGTTALVAAPPATPEAAPAEDADVQPRVSEAPQPEQQVVEQAVGQAEANVEKQKPAETARNPRKNFLAGSLLFAFGLIMVAIAGSRLFLGSEAGGEFLGRYDGLQPLPENPPIGLPAWLSWAHFFNMFLMAMIVKTGIDVRREKRPSAYWTPRGGGKKISLTLWLHQCLDIAWVALGAIFYVLLFTTGQWKRIVPTSWEVFPQALSAGLQYLSLSWPSENGWVFYNALQELAYFTTVFIAAPLAIISGLRMSSMWPKTWTWLPVSWARAVHPLTMIYFVVFTAIHVFLVFTTGLRGNLNAMFAARGDVDPSVYATDWTGTVVFLFALAVTGAGWWAARASFVVPVAAATGEVSRR